MEEGSGESGNISNDTTSNDENWLVSGNTVVLHVNQNSLNVSNIFVNFVSTMDQLDEWDLVGFEIGADLLTEVWFNFIIDDSNTSSEWLVHIG